MPDILTREELKQIDKGIDVNFEQTPVPADHLYAARWALCTVGEETMRLAMHMAALKDTDAGWQEEQRSVNTRADRYKYQLRHAFDLCARRLPVLEKDGAHRLDHEEFKCALDLLFYKAAEYADATRIMWAALSGDSKIKREAEADSYDVIEQPRQSAYGVLDRLLVNDSEQANAFTLLTSIFRIGARNWRQIEITGRVGLTAMGIVEQVKLKRGRISYKMITRFAKELASAIDHGPTTIIPTDWHFPWGSLAELDRFFTGLFARCLYHAISTHFGESRFKTSASEQRCLLTERQTLVDDLVRITDLSKSFVDGVVTALTLGEGMENPDPALQPFIPVGAAILAVPAIFVLSSNHRRNLLSLQNRVAKKAFDAASNVFEQVTTKEIQKSIEGLVTYKSNVRVPGSPKPEQVDLILGDRENDFVLVCELRSMITPGDPREVYDRIGDYPKKLGQAERKLGATLRALPQICDELGLDATRDWKLGGAVILDGAAGIPSSKPNSIPIVEKDIFVRVLTLTKNLDLTHAILCSPLWLPREGMDFRRERMQLDLCGYKFRQGTFTLTGRSYMRDSLPRYVSEAGQDLGQLRAARW
jgi:hypothetical protein